VTYFEWSANRATRKIIIPWPGLIDGPESADAGSPNENHADAGSAGVTYFDLGRDQFSPMPLFRGKTPIGA